MDMHQIFIRLSNVVAWLNLLVGLCAGLAFSYFSLTFLLNGNNDPLTYDAKSQKIVNELNSDGVYSQSRMSLISLDDMSTKMALQLILDKEARASAMSKLPACYENFPQLLDPSFRTPKTLSSELFYCWEQKNKSESRPLSFGFTPDQALEAWNNIAVHKIRQEEHNKKRRAQADAKEGIVISALLAIPYALLAVLNYIFAGSSRFIPWASSNKRS